MKDFYQYNTLRGYRLNNDLYRKMRYTIHLYSYYMSVVNGIDEKSYIGENDADNRINAAYHIKVIEEALKEYVREDYRDAVFEHTVRDKEYEYLCRKYAVSESTLKRYTQMFTYGVAVKLGEALPREK